MTVYYRGYELCAMRLDETTMYWNLARLNEMTEVPDEGFAPDIDGTERVWIERLKTCVDNLLAREMDSPGVLTVGGTLPVALETATRDAG